MHIAMLSPLEMRVPPTAYGGTELVVSLLTEELVRRGHAVTLFASGDSITRATLVPVCDRFLRGSDRNKNVLNMLNARACLLRAADFDIIHNHTLLEGMSLAGFVRTPMLTTLHGALEGDWALMFRQYEGWYNTISESAKRLLAPKRNFAGVIYNSIDVDSYPFNDGPRREHMLFLARLSPEKGPHLACALARKLGRPLIIAGNVDAIDHDYFEAQVKPQVDNRLIQYIGEADNKAKRELLPAAHCLVAPITWDEPFGLFFLEAMACGTPVVVFNRGSAPEVVKHGETGFVVSEMAEMEKAIENVHLIHPGLCREHVAKNFNISRMTDGYLGAYKRVMQLSGRERVVSRPARAAIQPEFRDWDKTPPGHATGRGNEILI